MTLAPGPCHPPDVRRTRGMELANGGMLARAVTTEHRDAVTVELSASIGQAVKGTARGVEQRQVVLGEVVLGQVGVDHDHAAHDEPPRVS